MLLNLIRKCQKIFFDHWLVIVGGLFLVILIESPLFIFPYMAKDAYRGINVMEIKTGGGVSNDPLFYLTRGKELLDGNGLGSPALREGKNKEDFYFSITEYVLVKPVVWLGLADKIDIVLLYNIYNSVGVFIIILLIYNLLLQMSGGKKLLSAITALFVVGGYSIIENKHFFYDNNNIYTRTVLPYTASLMFFFYLNLLYKNLMSRRKRDTIAAGIILGLLFYIYFFGWTFAMAATGILLILYLLKKDFISAKKIFFVLCIGVAIGAYNLFRIYFFVFSPTMNNFSYFSWLLHTHAPVFVNVSFAMLILFIIFAFARRDDKNLPFIFSLILAGWVALNHQIITGRTLEPNHYYWYFIMPTSIIIAFYMLWFLLNNDRLRKIIFIIFLAAVFLNTAVGQHRSILATTDFKLYEQEFRPFIDYLNTVSTPGVILTASEPVSSLFTVYTSHDLFWAIYSFGNNAPLERMKDTLFTYLYLNKDARNDIVNYLHKMMADKNDTSFYKTIYILIEGYLSGMDYDVYNYKLVHDKAIMDKYRKDTIASLSKDYAIWVKDNNVLQKYGVNYIIWDKNKHPEWDLSVIPNLKEILVSDNIHLYNLSAQIDKIKNK